MNVIREKMSVAEDKHELDQEWVALIGQAREIGMTVDEVREFLQSIVSQPT